MRVFGAVVLLGTVLGCGMTEQSAYAAPPETAPAALTSALAAIELAANEQDLGAVMAFYDPTFQGEDGFTYGQYQEALVQLWERYDSLEYTIDLVAWEASNRGFVAETLTTVQGQQRQEGRTLTLISEVRSRQQFQAGQIVTQTILSERSQLTSGAMPPTITVQLPEQVAPGEQFSFDAIVLEPLGERLLLGRAFDEGVTAEDFFVPRPLVLERLSSGGLFKLGQAPDSTDERWISSVIVREDGLVVNTQRLTIE